MARFYFAHPVSVYNTPLERAMLVLIAHCFPEVEVVNPNTSEYQKAYTEAKAATGGTHADHKGMDIFYTLLEKLDGCVSMPFLDCRMGLGVAGETQKTVRVGKPAWLIVPSHEVTPEKLDTFIVYPCNGIFSIRLLNEEEVRLLRDHSGDLKDSPPPFVVPHEETRLRTFIQYGVVMRPYAQAHLVSLPVPSDFYALDPKKK